MRIIAALLAYLCIPILVHAEDNDAAMVLPNVSQNQMIKLTDQGLAPRALTMKAEDSIVFFVNDTTDSLATLTIDYGDKKTHCATSNLKIEENGFVHSIKPYGPRDFASVCFHEKGQYPITVYGLKSAPKGIKSIITVE